MPHISKYARSIRGGFVKLCRTITGGFVKFYRAITGAIGKFYRAIRERSVVLAVTVAFICVPTYAIAWLFDLSNNLFSSIVITVIVTIWPLAKLMLPHDPLTVMSYEVWLAVLVLLTLALAIGDRFDSQLISFSAILVGITLPSSLVVGIVVRREVILLAGFAPALIAIMVYWFAGLAGNDEGYDLILAPLPVVFFGGAIWAPVTLLILNLARRHKDGKISGPGMQVLTMTMLFFPITLVAITLPTDLGLSTMWSNVSLALIGIFLSGVISEPLRRLFIEWGKLAPYTD